VNLRNATKTTVSNIGGLPKMEENRTQWNLLFKIGGIAALLAVFIFRKNIGAELNGIFHIGPEIMPTTAIEWFTLLDDSPFLGLVFLNIFDLVYNFLVGVMLLALFEVLHKTNYGAMIYASILGLVGIILSFASNQAFALLNLSELYFNSTSEEQRLAFLAAGEALLAINNPGMAFQGTAMYLSHFFIASAGLISSIIMLRNPIFSKLNACFGIFANVCLLSYFIPTIFFPSLVHIPFILAAPFILVWQFLIGRKLIQISKKDISQPVSKE